MKKRILVSGAFDPLHIGHIQLLKEASNHGDLIVALNSDEWILRKRGYLFMSFKHREILLQDLSFISKVIGFDDLDGTVCSALEMVKPDFFGNGGTRSTSSTPKKEMETCDRLGIVPVWNLGESAIDSKYLFLIQDNISRYTLKELEKLQKTLSII